MQLIDTHCHLNDSSFQSDLDEVLERAEAVFVNKVIVPGWDIESSKQAVLLSHKYPQIYAAVGIHPLNITPQNKREIEEIHSLAIDEKVVAIGEIGLDYFYDQNHKSEQVELLRTMLDIAQVVNKKVIIHSRNAMSELMPILSQYYSNRENNCPGILHAFEGTIAEAKNLSEMGFLFGAGGPITYKNSQQKKEVFSFLPEKLIVLETDSPYLTPVPHRGKRNEPSFLVEIGNSLASIRNQSRELLFQIVYQNSLKFITE